MGIGDVSVPGRNAHWWGQLLQPHWAGSYSPVAAPLGGASELTSWTPAAREHASAPGPRSVSASVSPSCPWWGGTGRGLGFGAGRGLPGPALLGPDPPHSQTLSRWLAAWPSAPRSWRVSVGREARKQCPGAPWAPSCRPFWGLWTWGQGTEQGVRRWGPHGP